ncbi:transcriptional regulator [Paenibacillus sp. N4]|uniref:transcriptional regulator n=1 Tax=Paenibacillus vietnamensis TaxID=2590547 RepID=UPI001CD11D61|nr:transcriptional regulator [Paenibacillus vietnamensis]MCA0754889.1 transcriptional regulator [Paenibacillus vietnamensis]
MGLGKPRSLLGKFIDKIGLKQKDLEEITKLSRNEVIKLCDGRENKNPYPETKQKIISALRKRGHDVRADDFW